MADGGLLLKRPWKLKHGQAGSGARATCGCGGESTGEQPLLLKTVRKMAQRMFAE